MLHETHLNWLRQLIACRSVTPNDDNAQHLICKIVKNIFPELQLQIQTAHSETTHNTSVIINGTSKKLTFAGHTDVVPADQGDWQSDPFQLTARENRCFGRGIVDMKGAIICFLAALDNLRQKNIPLPTVQIILTSDEEGSGHNGLQLILEKISSFEPNLIVIGEPTAREKPGDCVKVGRRGSLHARIKLKGDSYHVAYPGERHPIFYLEQLLSALKKIDWDEGASIPFFNSSSFQITEVTSGQSVENVIPATLALRMNIRYSPATSPSRCRDILNQALHKLPLYSEVIWREGAIPWLSSVSANEIQTYLGSNPFYKGVLSTDGGVSDGYKIATYLGSNIIEMGLPHGSAHQANESCTLDDLKILTSLYMTLLEEMS